MTFKEVLYQKMGETYTNTNSEVCTKKTTSRDYSQTTEMAQRLFAVNKPVQFNIWDK